MFAAGMPGGGVSCLQLVCQEVEFHVCSWYGRRWNLMYAAGMDKAC